MFYISINLYPIIPNNNNTQEAKGLWHNSKLQDKFKHSGQESNKKATGHWHNPKIQVKYQHWIT